MDDLERKIKEHIDGIPVPADVRDRAARIARESLPEVAPARRARIPGGRLRVVLIAILVLLLLAGLAAALTIAFGREDGLSVPTGGEGGRAGRAESPTLSDLPWLYQPGGAPRIDRVERRAALAYPPRTSYPKAVRALFASVVERGELPRIARVVPALPAGVVFSPGRGGTRPRLDLAAPWGYSLPDGRIRTPSLYFPPSVPKEQIRRVIATLERGSLSPTALPRGVRVSVPRLPACQIDRTGAAPCRLSPAAPESGAG